MTRTLTRCRPSSATTTWAASAASSASAMPTRLTPSCSQRDQLGHSLMYLTRGQPVVYYGDEQGFAAELGEPSGVGDQRAREDMFPSQVAEYNDNDLIGTDSTTAVANYEPGHPALPAPRGAVGAARRAPGARRRRPDPPLRQQRGRRLRLQPDRRRGPGRVPRGRKQRRDGEDRRPADVQRPHGVQGRVAGGHAADQDRQGGPGHRHRAAAVGRRVEGCSAAQGRPRRRPHRSSARPRPGRRSTAGPRSASRCPGAASTR